MRSRSNSGVRLDYYYRIVQKTILSHQDPVSGLLPANPNLQHAWVRDNVYSILAVWGLSMAYRKNADLDEDRAKTYELEMSCVKLMRSLLTSMMLQKEKIEKFKWTQFPKDAIHAKYCARTGLPVVGDDEWGHLQIDATSLYLLILAQMTASGLQICNNLDEVSLVQNLVFYIESAYCIPDYGIWERGDKTNHGLPELNASSIGLAKAALEAMNELDLFGARGGPASVIHVLADEAHKCQAVLQSMLPRESSSKEVDSSLLSVISFPAFAVDDPELIKETREKVLDKLRGKYGCKRFLRDGYKTPKEDPNRLYYEPWELKVFENIECEWPLFLCYLVLDSQFAGDKEKTQEHAADLDKMLVTGKFGFKLVPEMYTVPSDKVQEEYKKPGSQERVVAGRLPLMWAQSLYIVGKLLDDNFLACGELDPLNRRLGAEKKPDVVVQVVLLAEDAAMQAHLAAADIHVQTIAEVSPIEVQPARVLSKLYAHLGRNQKLGLSGRHSLDVGILSTSKLYQLQDRVFAFTPQYFDYEESYLTNDIDLCLYSMAAGIASLGSSWKDLGRPLIIFKIWNQFLNEDGKIPPAIVSTVKKLNSGYINGTRVSLGKMSDFLNTSCITSLNFLHDVENGYPDTLKSDVKSYLEGLMRGSLAWRRSDLVRMTSSMRTLSDDIPPDPEVAVTSSSSTAARKEDCMDRFSRSGSNRPSLSKRKLSVHVKGSMRKSRAFFGDDDDHNKDSCKLCKCIDKINIDGADPLMVSRRSGITTPSYDSTLGYNNTLTAPPYLLVEASLAAQELAASSFAPLRSNTQENIGREVGAGVMADVGGVGVRLQVTGAQGKSLSKPSSRGQSRSQTPERDDYCEPTIRQRTESDCQYDNVEFTDLIMQFRETDSLDEQGDILHYLVVTYGLHQATGNYIEDKAVTVKDLLRELYESACHQKNWSLVRHTAGMLGKRVEDLAKAVTDLLVRQKQVTVGVPPHNEVTITRPLPTLELKALINSAYGTDESTAMLTQELLVYLAMFIRTEPELFTEMLRLRVGLIIQVMALELARTIFCTKEQASEHLLNLSPFQMKNLLHHIMAGKEFSIGSARSGTYFISTKSTKLSRPASAEPDQKNTILSPLSPGEDVLHGISVIAADVEGGLSTDRAGQWIRRRRLDGALNRVPNGFYKNIWNALNKCKGINIEGKVIPQSLTQEMTAGEMKFALEVESVLNTIPQPEYRQLVVEGLMVLSLLVEQQVVDWLGDLVSAQEIVHVANNIFLQDQKQQDGDAVQCCARDKKPTAPSGGLVCEGAAYICSHFYDSAPSGSYGTMSYMVRALVRVLPCFPDEGDMDCTIN